MSVVLVGGGARSGKSAFALRYAERAGPRRTLIATARPEDAEMRGRIRRHRAERGPGFSTVEEPVELPRAVERLDGLDAAVVDCLTLWITNLLLRDETEASILSRVDDLLAAAGARAFPVVLVTSEVGMGLVPETPLGRAFRDIAGRAHQRAARCADQVYLAVLGTVLRLKPAPVAAVEEP